MTASSSVEGDWSGARSNPLKLLGLIIFMIGFVVFALEGFATVQSAQYGTPNPGGVLLGFFIGIVGMAILIFAGSTARAAPIPPPPPIQQPMAPAGLQGPVALNCPACGAPAQDMDRFGVAVCPHCGTRFLVR